MQATATEQSLVNKTTVILPIDSCFFLDFPETNEDCDNNIEGESEQIFCYQCYCLGQYFSGESLDDYFEIGHIICFVVFVLVVVIGIFGALANVLIIAVLHQRKSRKSFDTFLMTLACYDTVCSVFPILVCVGSIMYFQNWNRDQLSLYMYYIGANAGLFGRAGSAYMTVVISFERLLVIAFYSTRARNWFNFRRTRILSFSSVLFAIANTIPRCTTYVGENEFGQNITATLGLKHLLLSTRLHDFFYGTLKGYLNMIEFWTPFPLLLILNGLLFLYIFREQSSQDIQDPNRKNDIRAARMFWRVVVALFICNITPIVFAYFLLMQRMYYRELVFGVALSFVVNSAVNLPIYYLGGANFRRDTKRILHASFPCIARCLGISNAPHSRDNSNRTTGI